MGVRKSRKGMKMEPSGWVRPALSVLFVVHDTVGHRRDGKGMLKIEAVLEASSLGHIISIFITRNVLMRWHVVPFQDSLVCIYGVQKRVP